MIKGVYEGMRSEGLGRRGFLGGGAALAVALPVLPMLAKPKSLIYSNRTIRTQLDFDAMNWRYAARACNLECEDVGPRPSGEEAIY